MQRVPARFPGCPRTTRVGMAAGVPDNCSQSGKWHRQVHQADPPYERPQAPPQDQPEGERVRERGGQDPPAGDPNDNLLAIAMAERERLMRSGSARKPAAKATNGWARPTGGGGDAPKAAPKTPQSEGGPNDNLLAIALAERAKAGSSPRRSATPSRRSASPPRARASPKVGPFGMELACVERVLGGGCHLQVICGL